MLEPVEFWIPGVPAAKAEPNLTCMNSDSPAARAKGCGRIPIKYYPKKTKQANWAERVRAYARKNAPQAIKTRSISQVLVIVRGVVPKSWRKELTWPSTAPDLDNYEKLLNDNLEKLIFINDSRIVAKSVMKIHGAEPGIYVHIREIDEAETMVEIAESQLKVIKEFQVKEFQDGR